MTLDKRCLKKLKSIAAVFIFVTAVSLSAQHCQAKTDTDAIKKSIAEKQSAIDDAEKQKKELQNGLTNVKKLVSELEGLKKNLNNYVTELDNNLEQIQAKIEELRGLIADKEEDIAITSAELDESITRAEEQYSSMKKRMRFMYENGQSFYLDTLFGVKSFGEIISHLGYVERIIRYDREKLEEYRTTLEEVKVNKEKLEAEKLLLDEANRAAEEEEAALNALIDDKRQQISAYQSDINNKAAAIAEYEAEIRAQDETIKALEAAVAAERKKLDSGSLRTYDGGKFKWPAPSYTRISDEYGNRIHPILKTNQFHNGVDMAAPSGSPILAAYDGEVVAADYSSTMGNYIMIDHGDSLYTVYMHASALYVGKGAVVSRGQNIAAVGSTGRSTGPHLHFSVRLNGSYVNPWNYFAE